ncbi:hypothetical protein [Marinobacter sp. X15-166B]|uniref:AbiTii domain-containing protein n=1 Tax=Marinobacter sp. X15-166B TaxID=1897620 RepID=UPI00085CA4AC|nr:hypothetical protein [Marinobacter sp. X15-166B]OEY65356.1 hypothetical protein BG841_02040 [Marinobacter sp. X15-166B]
MRAPVTNLKERLTAPNDSLASIMPSAITLAMMLRQRSMATWLRAEFQGYGDDAALPPHRLHIKGEIMVESPQYGWIPAPLNAAQKRGYDGVDIAEGIQALEKTCSNNRRGGSIQIAMPPAQVAALRARLNQGAELTMTVHRDQFNVLLRSVRGAIYLWVRELIDQGMGGPRNAFNPEERAATAHLDTPEQFIQRAMAEGAALPVPGAQVAGILDRLFRRAR